MPSAEAPGRAAAPSSPGDRLHDAASPVEGGGRPSGRSAGTAPRPMVVPLNPAPPWLSALEGRSVTEAAAWCAGGAVWVRASQPGAARPWRLSIDGRAPDVVLAREDGALARAPASLGAAERAAIVGFARRFASIAGGGGTPWPGDAPLAGVVRALREGRALDDEGLDAIRGLPVELDDLRAFVLVVAGRWHAASEGPGLLATALRGDVHALRVAAAREATALEDAPLHAEVLALAGFDAAARRHAERALARGAWPSGGASDGWLFVARLARRAGDAAGALQASRRAALGARGRAETLVRAADELILSGAYDDAGAVLDEALANAPADAAVRRAAAALSLRAGRVAEAREQLGALDAGAAVDVVRGHGVALALEGRWTDAAALFDRALDAAPTCAETLAWRAEASLWCGDVDGVASRLVTMRARVQSPVHVLLDAARMPPGQASKLPDLPAILDALDEPLAPWDADPVMAGRRALARFGGHRGDALSLRVEGGSGLGLVPFRGASAGPLAARRAASDALRALATESVEDVAATLDALAAQHADSPHPLCYRGELALWLGRYEEARSYFEAARARGPSRWAHVGAAAAAILEGQWARAEASLRACEAEFPKVPGATTQVYVGEMWRLRGAPERAVPTLEEAVAAKPSRLSAWMHLALSHRALGDEARAASIAARVAERAPGLLADAARCLGRDPDRASRDAAPDDALLERALACMRGNRSSALQTYVDADGTLRVVRPAVRWREALRPRGVAVAARLTGWLVSRDAR